MKTVLTNCTVIDCTGRAPMKDTTVVIEGEKIVEVKPGFYRDDAEVNQVRVFDLEGDYVLPGLWDVHVHLGSMFPAYPRYMASGESEIDYAIRAGRNAMDALRVGITGVRVAGEDAFVDIAWRDAFENGVFVGPRLFVCGKAILATGGHGHGTLGAVEVDGPYEMRKAVREDLKHGVDQIKLMVTGGIMTAGEGMQEPQLLLDEIQAATEIAHLKGKRVCVHAGGPEGIKMAIRGGVDSIEHGYYLDDESVEMMVEYGVFYVPTIRVTQDEQYWLDSGRPDFEIEKAGTAAEPHREGLQKALKAGVQIACGSDCSPVKEFALREIEYLVKAGMTEMQALIAATRTSAELCDVVDNVGTVEVGKQADLIAVTGDPLENISNVRRLRMVLKEGKLVDISAQEGVVEF